MGSFAQSQFIHSARYRAQYLSLTLVMSLFFVTACTPPPAVPPSADSVPSADNAAESPASATAESIPGEGTGVEGTGVEGAGIEGTVVATGSFTGLRDHVVSGGVEIIEMDGQHFVQLGEDFSLDGAPDPKVGLGNDGYDPATQAGHLVSLTGASSYELPAGTNVQNYNEVYIWCEKFNVPLGVAQIQTQ